MSPIVCCINSVQSCHYCVKSVINKWAWLCFNKTLFMDNKMQILYNFHVSQDSVFLFFFSHITHLWFIKYTKIKGLVRVLIPHFVKLWFTVTDARKILLKWDKKKYSHISGYAATHYNHICFCFNSNKNNQNFINIISTHFALLGKLFIHSEVQSFLPVVK